MQVLIQVACSSGNSLRDAIAKDTRLDSFHLAVTEQKRKGRRHGWSKVHSLARDRHGAINIQWEASTRVLLCRVVTRKGGDPALIVGDFVSYLICRFGKRIQTVNILRR